MWILSKLRLFKNVNFVKNVILKMWICQKWDFENVNFVKNEIFKMLFFGCNVVFCHSVNWADLPGYLLNLLAFLNCLFGTMGCTGTASFCKGNSPTPMTCGLAFEVQLGLILWPLGASRMVRIHSLITAWRRLFPISLWLKANGKSRVKKKTRESCITAAHKIDF